MNTKLMINKLIGMSLVAMIASCSEVPVNTGVEVVEWHPVNTGMGALPVFGFILDGNTLYASTEYGVYESTDNGDSWSALIDSSYIMDPPQVVVNDKYVFLSFNGSIARMDKKSRKYEVFRTIGYVTWGLMACDLGLFLCTTNGVYRSLDDGITWTQIVERQTGRMFSQLSYCDGVLYATTQEELYRSNDGGGSWTKGNSVVYNYTHWAFAVDGERHYSAGKRTEVYITDNGGETFQIYDIGIRTKTGYVTSLAVSQPYLSAVLEDSGVVVSKDTGHTWTMVNDGLDNVIPRGVLMNNRYLFCSTKYGIYRARYR